MCFRNCLCKFTVTPLNLSGLGIAFSVSLNFVGRYWHSFFSFCLDFNPSFTPPKFGLYRKLGKHLIFASGAGTAYCSVNI
jgi:hypothetical protein